MIKLAISGCLGRMGQRIRALAHDDKTFKIVALLESNEHPNVNVMVNDIKVVADPSVLQRASVLIEFTTPPATLEHLNICRDLGIKMVIGTTGLTSEQVNLIQQASSEIPIVYSSNMSVGVNLLFKLANDAAKRIDDSYSFKIVEAHHEHKKDAPSGTAKTIAQIIEEASHRKVADIQSIREGEIVGDHEIILESPVDTLSIRHSAKTRDIFARGALIAAKFIFKKRKGLYDMQDVLGLK